MSAAAACFAAEFRLRLQYRTAAAAGLATQLFFGLARAQILVALYAAGAAAAMPLAHATDYVWISQALLMLLPASLDGDIVAAIRTGGLATELLRPTDAYALWLARALARRVVPTCLRGIPLIAVALAAGGLRPPASPEALAWLALSLPLAAVLSTAIATAASMTALWTVSADGVAGALSVAAWGFSGVTVPLPLFPDAWQRVIALVPLRGVIDTPARLWTGDLAGGAAALAIAHQAAWILVLVGVGRALLARGMRRIVHFGG